MDVTSQATVSLTRSSVDDEVQTDTYRIVNNGKSIIDTHLLVIAQGLPAGVQLRNRNGGITRKGAPYLRGFLKNGALLPGQSTVQTLRFSRPDGSPPLSYRLALLSGQGNP